MRLSFGGLGFGSGSASAPAPATLMFVGDSLIMGFSSTNTLGLRSVASFYNVTSGFSIDFVGQFSTGGVNLPDPDHCGQSGASSSTILTNFTTALATRSPRLAVVDMGINDVANNGVTGLAASAANFTRLKSMQDAGMLKDSAFRIIYMNLFPLPPGHTYAGQEAIYNNEWTKAGGYLDQWNTNGAWGSALYPSNHLQIFDAHAALGGSWNTTLMGGDDLHPAEAGWAVLRTAFMATCKGAIRGIRNAINALGVTITSPAPGATVTVGLPVVITGTITRSAHDCAVALKDTSGATLGAGVFADKNVSTFSYTWTPQAGDIGAFTLRATVTDAADSSTANASTVALTVQAAAVFVPTDISGLVLWSSADNITDTGNGTAASAMADLSPTGAALVEGGAGLGPLRRDPSGRRSKKTVEYSNGKWAKSTDVAHRAVPGNTPADFTTMEVYQPTTNGASYNVSWGSTTVTNRYVSVRRGTGTYTDQVSERDATNNNAAIALNTVQTGFVPQVAITVFDATAATSTRYVDGTAGSAISVPRSTTALDIFAEGALPTGGAPSLISAKRRRHLLVFNRKLTAPEILALNDWGAEEMGAATYLLKWKRGFTASATFGNSSNAWLVIAVLGESGAAGRGTTTYTSVYNGTSNQGYCLYADNNLDALADPTASNTDVVGSQSADSVSAATGAWVRMVDYLRANGETRNIMIVNCGVGGTSSVDWATGATTSPPAVNALIGAAKYRIREALKAPNSELFLVIEQFVNNTFGAATPATYAANWRTVIDELHTVFAASITKTRWVAMVQAWTTAYTGATGSNWADIRTAISGMVSGSTDMTIVNTTDGPWTDGTKAHLETGSNTASAETGNMKLGIDTGAVIRAAT